MATNIKSPIQLIKESPLEAGVLALKWQEFVERYPDTASFETIGEFNIWIKDHPEVDRDALNEILDGKYVQDAYFLLREQHEEEQMRTKGRIDRSVTRADLPHISNLETAYNNQPGIMEDDKDYQKITENLKKHWLEQNPGKDFKSRQGIDYLYGSLGNDKAPTLKEDAEKIFTDNHGIKAEKYKEAGRIVYSNPHDDPMVKNLRKTVAEHTKARKEHLGAPADIGQTIQNKSLQKFIKEYPEKAHVYTKKGGNIAAPQETRETREKKKKKTFLERSQDIYDWYNKSRRTLRAGRRVGGFTGRATRNAARAGERFVAQGGRSAMTGIRGALMGARAAIAGAQGVTAAVGAVANPVGLTVIAVIIVIIIIVFLIVLLAGGGGGCSSLFNKRVFVTSTQSSGDMVTYVRNNIDNTFNGDGLQAGDRICQWRADNATPGPLGGTWITWLSTNAQDAKDRIPDQTYVRTDCDLVIVVDNKEDLINGDLNRAIDKDESGILLKDVGVWTGTSGSGERINNDNCSNWTSSDSSQGGMTGDSGSTTDIWTSFFSSKCDDLKNHLYCFEQ